MSSIETVPLGEVASFIRGITFKSDETVPPGQPGAVACMRTKNVQEEIDLEDVWWVPRSFVKRDEQYLEAGDLLVSTANSWNLVGKCCWVPSLGYAATLGGFISALRPQTEHLDARYLYHWFSYAKTQTLIRSFGRQTTNISNLDIQRTLGMSIPLPPLPEQRRIAAILDKADALRAKRRQAIERLDELTQSIFLEMFGDVEWPKTTLDELVRHGDRINYGVVQPGKHVEGGVPLIRVGDLVDGPIDHSRLKHINPRVDSKHKRSRLRGDELLISCVGSIGVVVKADHSLAGCNIARAVARVPLNDECDRDFVAAYVRTPSVQAYFINELRTVSQPTLNIKQIGETKVIVPPLSRQREYSQKEASVMATRRSNRLALEHLGVLFASLQQRAFRGEL